MKFNNLEAQKLYNLLKKYGYIFDEKDKNFGHYMTKLNKFTELLFDKNGDIEYLSSFQKLIIRNEIFGVDSYADVVYDIKKERKNALNIIYYSIVKPSFLSLAEDDTMKMSSLPIDSKYKNKYLDSLGLDTISLKAIERLGNKYHIKTVYDLLSYSKMDLYRIGITKKVLNNIEKSIHKCGLKFIDELSADEKKAIISGETDTIIDNSSACWISDNISKRMTIADLKREIKNGKIDGYNRYVEDAMKIGIGLLHKRINPYSDDFEISYDELINEHIENFDITYQLYLSLFNFLKGSRTTLKDIIVHKKEYFNDMVIADGDKTKEELLVELYNFVYSLGFCFIDDTIKLKNYSDEIYKQTGASNRVNKLNNINSELDKELDERLEQKKKIIEELNKLNLELKNIVDQISLNNKKIEENKNDKVYKLFH